MDRGEGRSILMTADAVGGVWNYCMELARELCERGNAVHLATMGPLPSVGQVEQAEAIAGLKLYSADFALEWMDEPWEEVSQAGRWLQELAIELKPELIHFNQYVFGQLNWPAPTIVVGHSCVFSWFEAVTGAPPRRDWEIYQEQVRAGLRGADFVVTPTEFMLQALLRHYGPLKNWRVIYNGRDPEGLLPGVKRPYIFSAGRLWDEAKNLQVLVRAAEKIFWPIYVAGAQRRPGGHAFEVPPAVQSLGRLNEWRMARWFQGASIYAHPARYEPFGLTPLEAGLAGCALILGDLPSLREVWGDAALYVSPDDPEELAEAINELAAQPELRRQRSAFVRERALRSLPERMADEYEELYDLLCEEEPRAYGGIG